MRRGQVGVFQYLCFWVWWPAGSQAIDPGVWQISALDLGWLLIPALGLCAGQPAIDPVVHQHEVSGVDAQPGF